MTDKSKSVGVVHKGAVLVVSKVWRHKVNVGPKNPVDPSEGDSFDEFFV